MTIPSISRRQALIPILAAISGSGLTRAHPGWAQATPIASPVASPTSGLRHQGVTYDTGWNSYPGYLTRQVWSDAVMRYDLSAIRNDLHASSVTLYGTEIDRLVPAAELAAELGMHLWVQPRLINGTSAETIDHLTALATSLEPIRTNGGDIGINVGCELSVFLQEILDGNSFEERAGSLVAAYLANDLGSMYERLDTHLAAAASAARKQFNGPLTYSAGMWEGGGITWNAFDYIGVDAYRDEENTATYESDLASIQRSRQPVIITEFGCCTYTGAADRGCSGYEIVDWEADPPMLNATYTRDENEQAGYITNLLDLYNTQPGIHEAYVYTFVEESPSNSEPAYDLDMSSFGIVKMLSQTGADSAPDAWWVPKLAFTTLAARFERDSSAALAGFTSNNAFSG